MAPELVEEAVESIPLQVAVGCARVALREIAGSRLWFIIILHAGQFLCQLRTGVKKCGNPSKGYIKGSVLEMP